MSDTIRKILISGAAGFIGSHLTRRLAAMGYSIGVIEHSSCGLQRLSDVLDKIEVFRLDIRDFSGILDTTASFKPQALIHLATRYAVSHTTEDFEDLIQTNVLGGLNLLEGAARCGTRLFVNTSSCFVYAPSETPLQESSALSPMNLYALTKLQTEKACSYYADTQDIRILTLRLFPPYGPDDHPRRLIPEVIRSFQEDRPLKLTSGQQKWDFTEVGDVVQAYVQALEQSDGIQGHRIVNIGTGKAVRVREVVDLIRRLMKTEREPEWGALPHRDNERMVLEADIRRAGSLLHWKPRSRLEDGMAATVEWFRTQAPDER